MLTYQQMDWLPWSIRQIKHMLNIGAVDHFMIAEGAHSRQHPARSQDGSWEFLQNEIGKDQRFSLFDGSMFRDGASNYSDAQCKLLNFMLSKIKDREDNWLLILHDDQFIFNRLVYDLRNICSSATRYDLITPLQKEFAFNFNLQWNKACGGFLGRLYDDSIFYPISSLGRESAKRSFMQGSDGIWTLREPEYSVFHFGIAFKKTERARIRVELAAEKGSGVMRDYWYAEMYQKADVANLSTTYKKAVDIWDAEGFYLDSLDLHSENVVQKLNRYDGPWPEILADHPYRNISDIRQMP